MFMLLVCEGGDVLRQLLKRRQLRALFEHIREQIANFRQPIVEWLAPYDLSPERYHHNR
jgi:hypothetical protein